jgi:glutathione S-transferase
MYTLYYSPGTASLAVHLALVEIGAPYRLELVDFERKQQRDADYLRLNPQGRVPTLVIDDRAYSESAALLIMLADRHPEAGLTPATDTRERMAWYQSLVSLSNNLGATFRYWFYPADLGSAEHPRGVKAALQKQIEDVWTRLDKQLAEGGPYLLGAELSMADLLLVMYMRWSRNMPHPAQEWPALEKFARLLQARDSWQKVCAVENLQGWQL